MISYAKFFVIQHDICKKPIVTAQILKESEKLDISINLKEYHEERNMRSRLILNIMMRNDLLQRKICKMKYSKL